MVKILLFIILFESIQTLYFTLSRGESKCFSYDLTSKSAYIGEYQVLDEVPSQSRQTEGIRVNLFEPESRNYFSKIFLGKDRHYFKTKNPGIHKICFEGTRHLFELEETIRLSVRMSDEIEHDTIVK